VRDGVVTLTGTARSAAQKDLTEAYVKGIDHVKSVKNQLVVNVPAPSEDAVAVVDDMSITAQVKYALLTDTNTSAIRTKISTAQGVVVVSGEAASSAEKDIVTRIAQSVRGVKSVNNLMTVKS
jgi:osmotically-inducible protein OsmY